VRRCALLSCGEGAVASVRHPYRPESVTELCERHARRAASVGGVIVGGQRRGRA
jgi:hypothetical protein